MDVGDRFAIFHRDTSWVYGARVEWTDGGALVYGGLAIEGRDQILAEGWLDCGSWEVVLPKAVCSAFVCSGILACPGCM